LFPRDELVSSGINPPKYHGLVFWVTAETAGDFAPIQEICKLISSRCQGKVDFEQQRAHNPAEIVNSGINNLIQRAADELKSAGAREIYVFGSAARGASDAGSDIDLAVSGLPPSVFYRAGARVSDLTGCSVDLIDLDISTPFTRYLRMENELVRVG
jgi:predicted nucleotidyltransferase